MYGFVATLAHKVTLVPPEHRQDAASACWHAIQCIRNIFVGLGDIVATVSIERGRFVVLELKESDELQANGRIVLASSGAYAYCLKRASVKRYGRGEGSLGMVFFPMGSQLEEWGLTGLGARRKTCGMECARVCEHGMKGVERDDWFRLPPPRDPSVAAGQALLLRTKGCRTKTSDSAALNDHAILGHGVERGTPRPSSSSAATATWPRCASLPAPP